MKVNTIPGASYALTCTAACTIHALLSDASSLVILETENPGQYFFFIAPTDTIEVSDEHALVTQTFKNNRSGLSARSGIRPGVNADLKNPTVEKSGMNHFFFSDRPRLSAALMSNPVKRLFVHGFSNLYGERDFTARSLSDADWVRKSVSFLPEITTGKSL